MDDFDFDFGDWLGDISSGLDLSGGDTSWLDTFDWSGALENLDFSNLDLSNVVGNIGTGGLDSLLAAGPGNFLEDVEEQAGGFYGNVPGRAVYDPITDTTELYDSATDTLRTIEHGGGTRAGDIVAGFDESEFDRKGLFEDEGVGTIEIVGEREDDTEEALADAYWSNLLTGGGSSADITSILTDDEHTRQFEDDGAGTITIVGKKPTEDSILTDDEHTRTDVDTSCPPGSEKVYKYRDGSTMTVDCKGKVISSTPKTIDIDEGDDTVDTGCPPGSETTQTFDDGSTITYDCKGNVIKTTDATDVDDKVDTGCPPNSDTKQTLSDGTVVTRNCKGQITNITPPGTKKTDDLSKWIALLGGILGLLDKPKGGPAGYKGGIPKYIATRGPSRSPTEGGRRPGGAGIGSLTGGVTYTPVGAAGGGLMGLAEGGKARPARYLRGGTDGMADKIQTDIDGKQPARLSHGEFVIPADVVSHLGNGNSDAGADVLYDMMAKVRKARTGTTKQGKQINPRKYTPA